MRDEKQARSNKQTRQSNTAHVHVCVALVCVAHCPILPAQGGARGALMRHCPLKGPGARGAVMRATLPARSRDARGAVMRHCPRKGPVVQLYRAGASALAIKRALKFGLEGYRTDPSPQSN